MRDLIKAFKALSDETRIRMLKLLLERDICVCEMEHIFPISRSQVSRNLKILMDAGFLKRWREGKSVVYVADRSNCNQYCWAVLRLLADSFNDEETTAKDREKLRQVIADKVRERSK